jgi:hypothetical protein
MTPNGAGVNQKNLLLWQSEIVWCPHLSLCFLMTPSHSDFATGAVLSQQSPVDDKWHPITYYSKSLSAVERNYEIYNKEMLAII